MLEMSLEERALRHADEFFSGPEKWWRGDNSVPKVADCVGLVIQQFHHKETGRLTSTFRLANKALNVKDAPAWNDDCPDFTALKAHLKSRIAYYTKKRLANSYLVVIGPGRQVKL